MKPMVLACLALAITGCYSITPTSQSSSIPNRNLFGEIAITGLIIRDERLVNRFETAAYGGSVATAGTNHNFRAMGMSNSYAGAQSAQFETFDNPALQQHLIHVLQDNGIARKISPMASIRIEGEGPVFTKTTTAGMVAWDIFDIFSAAFIFGGPLIGGNEAAVTLRVFENGEQVGKYDGRASAGWKINIYSGVNVPQAQRQASFLAGQLAVNEALANLVKNPPVLNKTPGQQD